MEIIRRSGIFYIKFSLHPRADLFAEGIWHYRFCYGICVQDGELRGGWGRQTGGEQATETSIT